MSALAAILLRVFCDPSRQEELAGDLEELAARRSVREGGRLARWHLWVDLASVCLRQSRARRWALWQWVTAALLLVTVGAGAWAAFHQGPDENLTISAHDVAGAFTLTFEHGKLLEARVNELRVPASRIQCSHSKLVLLGAGTPVRGMPGDIVIVRTQNGGIDWVVRPAPAASATGSRPR